MVVSVSGTSSSRAASRLLDTCFNFTSADIPCKGTVSIPVAATVSATGTAMSIGTVTGTAAGTAAGTGTGTVTGTAAACCSRL